MVARTVLVTGSSRGLGLEMIRQLAQHPTPPEIIVATCRNPGEAKELQKLSMRHKQVNIVKLDLVDERSYGSVAKEVNDLVEDRGLNLLINNGGVAPKSTRINMVKWQQMVDTFLVNSVAPVMLSKTFLPLLRTAASQTEGASLSVKRAAIINISSKLGSIENNDLGGLYPYRASKSALNAITKSLSIDLREFNILVSSICPGWVQTDMGGKNALLTPEQSISSVLHLIATMNDIHHGSFYQYDGVKLPW